jgi:hypothetical protein
MMENAGARKISHYEDPVNTNLTELQHAAEEARHAFFLKKLIGRIHGQECPDFSHPYLLAPLESHRYLDHLDVCACRYLKTKLGYTGRILKQGAYLLVTYSIEVRADMLYGVYQEALTAAGSPVNVKSIIAEEEGHLAEMVRMLEAWLPDWHAHAEEMCRTENRLFAEWIGAISRQNA